MPPRRFALGIAAPRAYLMRMTGDDIGRLLYLALLGAVIAGYFFTTGRRNMGRTAQQAAIWGLIFVGVVAIAGLWPGIQTAVRDGIAPRQEIVRDGDGIERIVVPRGPDGHYRIALDVNGTSVPFVVDTGASDIVLSTGHARRAGIDTEALAYRGRARTANGLVETATVTLETVALGPIVDQGVRASVNGGDMDISLLGMTYLERFGRIVITGGELTLER